MTKTLTEKIGELASGVIFAASVYVAALYMPGAEFNKTYLAPPRIIAEKVIEGKDIMNFQKRALLQGFDRNEDGQIDEIKEYFTIYLVKTVAPWQNVYNQRDRKFEELKRQLEKQ